MPERPFRRFRAAGDGQGCLAAARQSGWMPPAQPPARRFPGRRATQGKERWIRRHKGSRGNMANGELSTPHRDLACSAVPRNRGGGFRERVTGASQSIPSEKPYSPGRAGKFRQVLLFLISLSHASAVSRSSPTAWPISRGLPKATGALCRQSNSWERISARWPAQPTRAAKSSLTTVTPNLCMKSVNRPLERNASPNPRLPRCGANALATPPVR